MAKLDTYNKKRDFSHTDEPKGKVAKKNLSRFVIQHHYARREHYDFRLEYGGVLVSFAVPKGLPLNDEKHLAVHVEDHPVDYINFKGTIPKGNYGAGEVFIFDKGKYLPLDDIGEGLEKGHIKVELFGKTISGVYNLIRTKEPNWIVTLSKTNDSKQSNKEKRKKNPFHDCDVKLATLTTAIPTLDYIFEIKYDGYRIVAFIENKITLKSRNNKDYSDKFASVTKSLEAIQNSAVLDGEVVVFDKTGRSDFALLTDSMKRKEDNFCYVVFDILALDGKDLRDMPLIERKKLLNDVLSNCPKNIIISSFVEDKGEETFALAQKLGLEGIVAKKIHSLYNGERDNDWLKIKCYKRQEFVITGYSTSPQNKLLSAIYVGYYEGDKLIFAGKVGTGFNNDTRKTLNTMFLKLIRSSSPFIDFTDKDAIYLTPKLVAEIQYAELTKNKVLRQPSFVGLREDKKAKDVHLEISKDDEKKGE